MASQVNSPNSPSNTLPTRSATNSTDADEAVPDEDSSETTKLFHERLQAWKHACAYIEDYVKATEKMHEHNSKEYEKVLKTVNSPLKEGHHFQQQNGGVAGMFENIRSNTQGLANSHTETAKTLKGSVLPTFERLTREIKNKTKELEKGAGKGSKAVQKARNESQKQIELLGSTTGSYDSRGGHLKATEDPYILQRRVYHHLNKQVTEENSNRDDMIAVQNNFQQFETHVLQTIQSGLQQFTQVVGNQAESTRGMYGDMSANAHRIPPHFEWEGFLHSNSNVMIDPHGPKRSVEHISFANQDHSSTKPLIAGSLERRSGMLKQYNTSYYVVTPSRYMHEFKSDDDFSKDPAPETSLFLPDCMIGAVEGVNFNIKGKDASKGALSKVSMSHEFKFKAHTPDDARKWHEVIANISGGTSNSVPSSPVTGNSGSPTAYSPQQTTGSTNSMSPTQTHSTGSTAAEPLYMGGEKGPAGPYDGVSQRDNGAPPL
ncbi:hypothetical protein LTR37_009640 [Vermiconidia calcicola]|uniref:Uncharacterized protein n=1 Tax=Vermiconidia calcicola TaxID=1690605 RepID=A0ACC3N795_9PEZI|nr:hypothetical protein LTR37_009640 [Vermiconidia calcicola]